MTRVNILEGNLGAGTKRRLERPLRLGFDAAGVVILLAILAAPGSSFTVGIQPSKFARRARSSVNSDSMTCILP
jgi:hypothetical protein